MTHSRRSVQLISTLLLTVAAGCAKPLVNLTDFNGDGGNSESGTDGASTGEPTSGGSEPTTGVPAGCPEGQEHLAPLWTVEFSPQGSSFGFHSGKGPIGRMADGRIVVAMSFDLATDKKGISLLVVTPEGELLAPTESTLGPNGAEPYVLRIGPDDQPLLLGGHFDGEGEGPVSGLTRFASDLAPLSEVELAFPTLGPGIVEPTMALAGDAVVVAGFDAVSKQMRVAKLAPDTGVPAWQVGLAGPEDMWVRAVAVGPQGDVAVAAHADVGFGDDDTLRLWRFDSDGGLVWERVITVPEYEDVTALHFAPDDQIVVLRGTTEFTARVELLSVEVDSGATRWALTVAEPEGEMTAWAQDMLIDADGFTVPVSRSRGHHDGATSMHTFEVREVSFAGELLAVTPLPSVYPGGGISWMRSVRGRCGELILVEEYASLRILAFAP
ncbi:MAG: hypothetical protein H0T76_04625 [Nannocystis sp.]|nr:hypothetical protein [Nannocystis sp.]MBA3545748.1 hypothetical protein [Nannocystis sp.]